MRSGESRGVVKGLLGFDLWAWLGKRSCRRVGAPAAGGGHRWSPCSGEPPAGERQRVTGVVLRWSMGGAAGVGR
jgi:hypothetical protein